MSRKIPKATSRSKSKFALDEKKQVSCQDNNFSKPPYAPAPHSRRSCKNCRHTTKIKHEFTVINGSYSGAPFADIFVNPEFLAKNHDFTVRNPGAVVRNLGFKEKHKFKNHIAEITYET